jgi:hypothetical protein
MRIKLPYVTPLLAGLATAAAIAAAPTAMAAAVTPTAGGQSCTAAVCDTPGNVQIDEYPGSSNGGFTPYGNFHEGPLTGHGGGGR